MPKLLRQIFAVVIGIVVGSCVNMALVTLSPAVIPPPAGVDVSNAESLKQRLMEYYKKTSPLIGYYYAKGQLSSVDGLAEMDAVAAAVAKVLDKS